MEKDKQNQKKASKVDSKKESNSTKKSLFSFKIIAIFASVVILIGAALGGFWYYKDVYKAHEKAYLAFANAVVDKDVEEVEKYLNIEDFLIKAQANFLGVSEEEVRAEVSDEDSKETIDSFKDSIKRGDFLDTSKLVTKADKVSDVLKKDGDRYYFEAYLPNSGEAGNPESLKLYMKEKNGDWMIDDVKFSTTAMDQSEEAKDEQSSAPKDTLELDEETP